MRRRYLILGNQENLDADARWKLDRLLDANEAINTAYILNEQFRWLFSYKRMGWAMRALENWCEMALAVSGQQNPTIRNRRFLRRMAAYGNLHRPSRR